MRKNTDQVLHKWTIENLCNFHRGKIVSFKRGGLLILCKYLLIPKEINQIRNEIIRENPGLFKNKRAINTFKRSFLLQFIFNAFKKINFNNEVRKICDYTAIKMFKFSDYLLRISPAYKKSYNLFEKKVLLLVNKKYGKVKNKTGLIEKKFNFICKKYNYETLDRELFKFLICYAFNRRFRNSLFHVLDFNFSESARSVPAILPFHIFGARVVSGVKRIYNHDEKFLLPAVILLAGYDDPSDPEDARCAKICIGTNCKNYLLSKKDVVYNVPYFDHVESKEKIPVDEFNLPKQKMVAIDRLITKEKSGNVFLYK